MMDRRRMLADGSSEVLRTCPLLAPLDEEAYVELLRRTRRRRFRRNEVIFHAGDPGDALLVIEAGAVKVLLASDDGDEAIIAFRGPSEFIGAMALLDGGHQEVTTVAVEPSNLRSIPAPILFDLVDGNPAVRRALLAGLAGTTRELTRRIAEIEFIALPGRVATCLVDLARQADPAGAGAVLTWRHTQADLAAMVGGSRQRVNRILGDLSDAGLVRMEPDVIVIPDVDALLRTVGR